MAYIGIPSEKEMKILSLIDSPLSGKAIGELYKKKAGFEIPSGILYSTLRRLTKAGFVISKSKKGMDGRFRLFQITYQGIKALNKGRRYHHDLADFGVEDFCVLDSKLIEVDALVERIFTDLSVNSVNTKVELALNASTEDRAIFSLDPVSAAALQVGQNVKILILEKE